MNAHDILQSAAGHMNDRAATYDRPQGERSMGATIAAFLAVSGVSLTEEQGWLFMVLLKAVRSQQGAYRSDSYEDGAAYFALAGEAAFGNRGEPSIASMAADFGQQHTIEPAAAMDEDSPRMQAIAQNGNDGEAYSEIDRLRAAADFNDDVPVTIAEAIALGAVPKREPCKPRHRCQTCAGGHATHECGAHP